MERRKGNKKFRKGRKNILAPVSGLMRWLLRTFHGFSLLRASNAGFVIPTALMLLLVMSLVISSMLIRTSQRTRQVIGEREIQSTYNAATPAIERAKSKIKFLFESDGRLPNGGFSEDMLEALMLNVDDSAKGIRANTDYPYTLPDETRLEIPTDDSGNNYKTYNVWSFNQDRDGDDENETVIYSIMMRAENEDGTIRLDSDNEDKAYAQVNRNGPLGINTAQGAPTGDCDLELLNTKTGWYTINGSSQRKNFQVNAVVVKEDNAVATLEYHQDRQVEKGNKWGAWSFYDMFIEPAPVFRFNGSLHSEGSILVGPEERDSSFQSFLVSSPSSCIFSDDASQITITEKMEKDDQGNEYISYQGQIIALTKNRLGAKFHTLQKTSDDANENIIVLNQETDSVADGNQNYNDLLLDPVALLTNNKFQVLGSNGDGGTNQVRDDDWNGLNGRVRTQQGPPCFVDDTYRADNRWGPKANYNSEIAVSGSNYGNLISNTLKQTLTTDDPPGERFVNVGLDGYWERRARAEGLRLIVGQRLELGNANGWGGSGNANIKDDDPLYPYKDESGENLDLQRRTLRDNLAAVQATAVYHYQEGNDGYFPVTVLASTSHPGTFSTWRNSTTFDKIDYIPPGDNVDTDFLTGKGTNGWEFEPPAGNETTFARRYDYTSMDLRKALNNLAHFAGDPNGAFPPTQETFGAAAKVHPYPYLTMWGDFSNLRRIVDDNSTNYSDLSIADKSTLHTAAAALGMLAYNIENREGIIGRVATLESGIADRTTEPNMQQLGAHLWQLVDGTAEADNPEIALSSDGTIKLVNRAADLDNAKKSMSDAKYYGQFTTKQYLEAVEKLLPETLKTAWKEYGEKRALQIREAILIARDRAQGFAEGRLDRVDAADDDLNWDDDNGNVTMSGRKFSTACHPEEFKDLFASLPLEDENSYSRSEGKIGLALAFCSEASNLNQPHYPALYYLFPTAGHNQGFVADPNAEEYLKDAYINSVNPSGTITYQPVTLANIALTPRPIDNWKLPISTSDSQDDSAVTNNKSKIQGSAVSAVANDLYLAIQDKAFYDGRELMLVRALEINLDLLRQNQVASGKDWLLPSSGIVYGFREDAVREDGIARPKNNGCSTFTNQIATHVDCRMNARSTEPQDPPQNFTTGLSPKPVDFHPDPDRRPYGFRLKNGRVLYRGESLNTAQDVTAGMSFISDNPVYIQGTFNLHSTDGTINTLIEEFNTQLRNDYSNFYDRDDDDLNINFARNDQDTWRPTEILGDAITILSQNFCDGYIEDGLADNNRDCPGVNNSKPSYLNSVLTELTQKFTYADMLSNLMREENLNRHSPIRLDRNGNIYYSSQFEPFSTYRNLKGTKIRNRPKNETQVNAVLITGVPPERPDQPMGGLVIHTRVLESWGNIDLNIQGSFLQIKFSIYATGPHDRDAWNVSRANIQKPHAHTEWAYYGPPIRKWGYDVALKYRPPAPISDRFISYGAPRNEFYHEMPSNDPYNQLLFCARVPPADSNAADPNNAPIYKNLCK